MQRWSPGSCFGLAHAMPPRRTAVDRPAPCRLLHKPATAVVQATNCSQPSESHLQSMMPSGTPPSSQSYGSTAGSASHSPPPAGSSAPTASTCSRASSGSWPHTGCSCQRCIAPAAAGLPASLPSPLPRWPLAPPAAPSPAGSGTGPQARTLMHRRDSCCSAEAAWAAAESMLAPCSSRLRSPDSWRTTAAGSRHLAASKGVGSGREGTLAGWWHQR